MPEFIFNLPDGSKFLVRARGDHELVIRLIESSRPGATGSLAIEPRTSNEVVIVSAPSSMEKEE